MRVHFCTFVGRGEAEKGTGIRTREDAMMEIPVWLKAA